MAHAREALRRLCGPDDDGFHRDTYRLRYDFGVDAWWFAVDPSTHLFELGDADCVALLRGLSALLARLRRRVDRVIAGSPMFFRLSSRSAKDVDGGIRATCFDDVVRACARSERLREDLELHVEHAASHERMYLVLRPWIDIVAEHRVFVVGRRVLCASTCAADPEEAETGPFERGCSRLLGVLPYEDCAVDFATVVGGDGPVPIEVNPLWAFTDLYAFE